jgi:hypothetical protein
LKRLLMAAAMLSLSCLATAAAPDTLGYQGRLTNGGVVVNGTVTVTFRLYNVASGGTALWTEANSVAVANGLYSVILGHGTAFPGSLFTQPLWLGVSLNGDPEMTPRQPLTSTPYSQRAKSADTANYASALSVTPTACGTGQFAQGISAAGNAVGCASVSALQGQAVANIVPTAGQVLIYSGTQWQPTSLAATQQLPTVACASGQVAQWNGSAWNCGSLGNLTGNLSLPTSSSASAGNILKNGVPFIHDYGDGNTFVGENAGNFTMTSNITPPAAITGAYNTAIGGGALSHNTTGAYNTATGLYALTSNQSGGFNTATGQGALQLNTSGSFNTATGQGTLVSNTTGYENTATGQGALQNSSTGYGNTATGQGALQGNTTGAFNTAIGDRALLQSSDGIRNTALGIGAGRDLTSGSDNIYIGNAGMASESNTIRIGTNATHYYTHIAGIVYTSGPINPPSDVNLKTDFEAIDPAAVLNHVVAMPVRTWRYKIEPPEVRHIGPTAQDFSAAFAVGGDDKHIATVDADGVAMAAIQGLYKLIQERDTQLQAQAEKLVALEQQVSRMTKLLSQLADTNLVAVSRQ